MSRSRVFSLLVIAILATLAISGKEAKAADLENGFQKPADADKPWAYWWWLKANVDEKSITHDLEEMRDKGFGGLLLFDARGYHESHVPPPPSRADFMSPQWRRMVKYSMAEANRLGITMSINLSSCAGALKGPWNVGADSPKQLLWTAIRLAGPKQIQCRLNSPKTLKHFNEICVMAVRRADGKVIQPTKDLDNDLASNWRKISPLPKNLTVIDQVVDLTHKVDEQERLNWNVPEGSWIIFRFGYAAMEGHEFDVDVLDPKAVAGHYRRMGKALIEDAGPLAGKTLTHFYSVSWEGAIPTWTGNFESLFKKYRGYEMRDYLPVLAGMTLKNTNISNRFVNDYYKTLGDGFRDNFYGTLRRLSNADGIKWHSESGGPWTRGLPTFSNADQLAFLARNDMPQGEFWFPGRYMNRQPAMAAHIYGKRLAATEAFTHMGRHWCVYPDALKPCADATFCDGINQFIWHTFTASPPELGKPGSEYFAGSHINPNVTWWPQAGPFLAYLGRCQHMLRQGRFVADVCTYVSDAPYQHWGRFKTWRPGSFLRVGKGNSYDLITTEALIKRAKVENGQIVLPDGMRYRVLAVDLAIPTVPLEVLHKIIELAEAGATVVLGDVRATQAPGLKNYPACDAEAARLGDVLWGIYKVENNKKRKSEFRKLGQGRVFTGTDLDTVFKTKGILPDFEGPFDYTHRRADGVDIYFLAGQGSADCVFRVTGKEPELWDPTSGQIRDAVQWRTTKDGRTIVPIDLPKHGSTFVVFRRPAETKHLTSVKKPDGAASDAFEIISRIKDGVRFNVWQAGDYTMKDSLGKTQKISIPTLDQPLTLSGPWSIDFMPAVGQPFSTEFEKLAPWDQNPNERIKHFSGTATYKKTFELNDEQAGGKVRLRLGTVKNIARVRLNGKPLGIIWTSPWTVDITGVAKAGENELEIEVTNTWVNRLIGDAGLPPEKRLTKTNVLLQKGKRNFRAWKGFASEDPLEPAGLTGPVKIEFGCKKEVKF
ncbi:MAG: hypothetical protein JXM70_07795 [Pirellulales bacterium]|nr:hypothetical protein [Pirellulales bacterium]